MAAGKVSQSVGGADPSLRVGTPVQDCSGVFPVFQKGGVKEDLDERELFSAVSGLNIPASYAADFLAEVEAMMKMNEHHVQKNGRKAAAFLKDVAPHSAPCGGTAGWSAAYGKGSCECVRVPRLEEHTVVLLSISPL